MGNDKMALDALRKKAFGFETSEVVEEYANLEGEIQLTKKKVTTKTVPPDCTAIKMLLESTDYDFKKMTDEELERERDRLLKLLKEMEN